MHLIGFTGVIGAGKTTLAKQLAKWVEEQSLIPVLDSVAAPLKQGFASMGITKDTHPELRRDLFQHVGTDAVRSRYPDWWVDRLKLRLSPVMANDNVVVIIDDIRFANELRFIHEQKGISIYVDATRRVDLRKPEYWHTSETLGMLTGLKWTPNPCNEWIDANSTDIPLAVSQLRDIFARWFKERFGRSLAG